MAIELRTQFGSQLRVDVSNVCAQLHQEASPFNTETWKRLQVLQGNRLLSLGQLFDVVENPEGPEGAVIWKGNTAMLDGVASGMRSGQWTVEGDTGNRVAEGIRGGFLRIDGSVGHNLAVNNRGGHVVVEGNAGDYVAASLPGNKRGGNGACIGVKGSVGEGAARRMRRGTLAIGGRVGLMCGYEMLAGTLILSGELTELPGSEMRRGTLILLNDIFPSPEAAGFQRGRCLAEPTWPLIRKQIATVGFDAKIPAAQHRFLTYHASSRYGSRGELWLAEPCG